MLSAMAPHIKAQHGQSPETFLPLDSLKLNSQVYVFVDSPATPEGVSELIFINETYRRSLREAQLMNRVWGSWSGHSGFLIKNPNIWDRRKDLTGVVLRTASLSSPPFMFEHKRPDGQIRITGIMADVWDNLQVATNCS